MKNNYRLSPFVKPERYIISLTPDLKKFVFSGEEAIHLKLEKSTKEIILHAAELKISKAVIVSKKKNVLAKISYSEKEETVTLKFPKPLAKGKIELHLFFTGILNDKMRGFYRSRYEIDGKELYMATTQFESTDARRAFPCIDEPAAKAVFEIILTIPLETTAISNTMPITTKKQGKVKTVQFSPTPKMSTYLVAFVVGQFESIEQKTKDGILVKVFATPGKKKQSEFALDTAAKLISFYNSYFAIPYPLPVLDLIAIPDFAAGAMENWGAVTFRESALLIDPKNSSSINKQWVAQVIAHELAHMWFGDLVTMEWWTHLWLNEGFATFIEYVAIDNLFPEWELWKQFVAGEHNSALSLDALANTHPIEVPVYNPAEIGEIFDQISYDKGSSVLYMLYTYLGATDFRDGLRYYLKKFAYQNTVTEDLWRALEKVSKKPVEKIMKNWTGKAGHPVVTVKDSGKNLSLSQKRFFSSPLSAKKSKDTTIWQIPLPVLSERTAQKVYLMSQKNYSLPKPAKKGWIKLNNGESSFVRFSYPSRMLDTFQDAIISKILPATDRLGLVRDAFDLAAAGIAKTDDALNFVLNYEQENEYVVWIELVSQLQTVENLISLEKGFDKKYQEKLRPLFDHIAKNVGWVKRPHEKHSESLLRGMILYIYGKYGDEKTVEQAHRLFEAFRKQAKPIEPDIRSLVYNLVAKNGDKKIFDYFVSLYRKEHLSQEKDRISRALTAFDDPKLLAKTLEWSLSSDVRVQDRPRLILFSFMNPHSRELAWQFVKDHWKELEQQYAGSHGFSRVIEGAKEFVDNKNASEVESFFQKNPAPDLDRTVKQVVEQIKANAEWKKRAERERSKNFSNDHV